MCNFLDIYFIVIFFDAPAPGRYISGGEERGREKEGIGGREGESKLQLAEVFGLNSENDPFNSDGL